jgi:hypothetical protein
MPFVDIEPDAAYAGSWDVKYRISFKQHIGKIIEAGVMAKEHNNFILIIQIF